MKNIIKNTCMFFAYFIYEIIVLVVMLLLKNAGIDFNNSTYKSIYLIITSLIYIIFAVFIYKDELKEDFNKFKKDGGKLFLKYLPIYIVGIILMGALNIIISKITNSVISNNEQTVRETIKLMPIYMFFSVSIYAPIVEEITFRKTFKNILHNKYLFIIVSGLIFGLIHISGDVTINNFLMSIPYMVMGWTFGYIYYESDNIFTTMTLHFVHNTILFILQIIGG